MSAARNDIKKLGYDIIDIKSAADLKYAKLRATVNDLCSGEVDDEFAVNLFKTENKQHLKGFKVVESGDHEKTVGIAMYVTPMRTYSRLDKDGNVDVHAKLLNDSVKELGFDQEKQQNEAVELLVFCVKQNTRSKSLGQKILLHVLEQAKQKYIVIGQELGDASGKAVKFYELNFSKFVEGEKDGKKFRFYAGLSSDVAKSLGGDSVSASASKPSKKPAKKPVKKPAAKKPTVAGKRRRAGLVCGKVVRRSNSFLNSVGKTFKALKGNTHSTLSMKAACSIDAILRDTLESVGLIINSLLQSSKSKTANVRTVDIAIRLRFGAAKELLKFAVARGVTAETKFKSATAKKRTSQALRAGLLISPARVARLLRESRAAPRVGVLGAMHLAGALQYLCEELIGNSLDMIKVSKAGSGRLTPRVLMFVISKDEELNKVFRGKVGGAGVVPMPETAKKQKTK